MQAANAGTNPDATSILLESELVEDIKPLDHTQDLWAKHGPLPSFVHNHSNIVNINIETPGNAYYSTFSHENSHQTNSVAIQCMEDSISQC